MIIKVTEPRKRILIDMFKYGLVLLRSRTVVGTNYSFIKPSGETFSGTIARINKYHLRFLEENNLVSAIWTEPMADRFVLTAAGSRLGKTLSRLYDSGPYKGKAVEIELTGVRE